jgi:hypothetical protein
MIAETALGLDPGAVWRKIMRPMKMGGGASVLPLFCWCMIRKSGYRFSEKIMLRS